MGKLEIQRVPNHAMIGDPSEWLGWTAIHIAYHTKHASFAWSA